jgi:hypothetical protein
VSISYVIVENWTTYRTIIESESNAIVVNTYDEFLPVPDGYLKEAWADKVADFMLNRWGTWVHVGGYPYYRVWFQNGTQVEWGEAGFQRVMSQIGKGNETCYPPNGSPEEWSSSYPVLESIYRYLGTCFRLWPASPGSECIPGFPLGEDFRASKLFVMFDEGPTTFHAAIRFSPNGTSFNFGVYVHLGTWLFREGGTDAIYSRPAAYAGFLATAVAIYLDYSSLCKLYASDGESASEAILKAQNEGRTVGFNQSLAYFQNALDAYEKGEYKTSASYADISIAAAQGAKTPTISYVPTILSILIASMLVPGTSVLYSRLKRREARNAFSKT